MKTIHHNFTIKGSLHCGYFPQAKGHLMDITCMALLFMSISLMSVSCRKELCYNHWEHASGVKADIDADYEQEWEIDNGSAWEQNWDEDLFGCAYDDLRPDIPDGLRLIIYRESGHEERNIDAAGELVPLYEGEYSILFYNNDTEYLIFDELGSSATAMATTRTRTRFSLAGTGSVVPTRGYNPPDMLYGYYIDSYVGEKKFEADPMPVHMHPLVYNYLIVAEFDHGLKYVMKARGEIAGMATGVYLRSGTTSEESGTLLFDTDVCKVTDDGVLANVLSFGIPGYPYDDYSPTKSEGQTFALVLEVELSNGATKRFDPVDISAQLKAHPRGGVIKVDGFVVTDDEGIALGGGFDVDVDGWGDYEDIPLPIG